MEVSLGEIPHILGGGISTMMKFILRIKISKNFYVKKVLTNMINFLLVVIKRKKRNLQKFPHEHLDIYVKLLLKKIKSTKYNFFVRLYKNYIYSLQCRLDFVALFSNHSTRTTLNSNQLCMG